MTRRAPSIIEALADNEQARAKRRAARTGWTPHDDPYAVPPGYHARGVSTLRRGDGSIALQWQKTQVDADAQHQAILDAFANVAVKIPRVRPSKTARRDHDSDLLAAYVIGDPHLGMYAWGLETLDRNFDLEIAARELVAGVAELTLRAPPAETALVIPIGDFFHADNMANRTTRSGHPLDVDGRYGKIASAGVLVMVAQIEHAKRKHKRVVVRVEIGNHDDHSAQWLALCLEQRYHDDERVEIVTSPAKFWYYEFGANLIGTTHGDTVKRSGPTLAEIMAHDRPEAWARTRFRRWEIGHVHNLTRHERPGVMMTTHRTMAARDGWTAGAGYRAGQGMTAFVLHREFGERIALSISQYELQQSYTKAVK